MGKRKERKLSTEEMAKTQVINLDDVKKLASYEKLISKKPAFVVALAGVLAIIAGVTAQTVVSLSSQNNSKEAPEQQTKVIEEKDSGIKYTCYLSQKSAEAEIDIKLTYDMSYDEETNIINEYEKTTEVLPLSTSSTTALASIESGLTAFQVYPKYSIEGYDISVSNYKTGYKILITADNTKINAALLDPSLALNQYVAYDIPVGSTIQQISANLKGAGYICK